MIPRPASDEHAPFYAGYVASLEDSEDAGAVLRDQLREVPERLGGLDDERAGHRYAPGKWSVREVVGHLADSERVFAYRMLRIVRGDGTPLAGFSEDDYVAAADFDDRPLAGLLEEWTAVRRATLALVETVRGEAWARRAVANGTPISARALAYALAGHTRHHLRVLAERYGVGG